jgi:outer membrane protein TolC
MKRLIQLSYLMVAACAAGVVPARAQAPAAAAQTLRLTADDAVKMAIDRNLTLASARIDPRIGDTQVAAAAGAFRPVFNTGIARNNQLQPPSNLLVPEPQRTNAITSTAGLSQTLPWFGTSYEVSWTAAHTDSNSALNSFNPVLESGLSMSISQPLLRNLAVDDARQRLATSRIDRDIADTRLHETLARTTAEVKEAYWHLVDARANVEARQSALELANELVRVNKARVDAGDAPPLDLVAAQAEVASDREQLIVAETAVKNTEDDLRTLIYDTSEPGVWDVHLVPADLPRAASDIPSLDAAVKTALSERQDLTRARAEVERGQLDVKYTGNQKLPDVRLNASYLASGLGGTQVLRTGGFPGTIIGEGSGIGFGSVLNQLLTGRYDTWSVGISVNYPLGRAVEDANYAKARLEREQSAADLKSAEGQVVKQVRNAWRTIEMNAKRIDTTRAARDLAEQRLDAERKRFDVGMSTSFLVIQAQRDLTVARTNELAAVLAYNLALVDFEAVQQAAPATAATASAQQ